jgi:uncharacterized iron-regulated membrane protein
MGFRQPEKELQEHDWKHRPQKVRLRRLVFQVHLWSGVCLGIYVFFISLTGSVLVYRNELYVAATPEPALSRAAGPILDDADLRAAAAAAYPDFRITELYRPTNPEQAAEVWLERDGRLKKRLFDVRSGEDVGSATAVGIWLVSTLIELHADLLGGPAGRKLNGLGAFAVLLSALTGLIIWWPGIRRWRRSLTLRRGVGWKRFNWDLHSAMGFWSFGFTIVFALSALYLSYPPIFHDSVNWWYADASSLSRPLLLDNALAWLAYSHFGRINGIGLFCDGPGLCDQTVKAVWAIFGLAPAAMFVTGIIMWWNRVLRPWRRRTTGHGNRKRRPLA